MREFGSDSEYLEKYQEELRTNFNLFLARSFMGLRPNEPYRPNWHQDAIAHYLMACKNGEIKRLIINMPPRSLKSICVSVAYPAWVLGNDPMKSIICASYAQTLSNQHSLDCRSIIESDWYKLAFPGCKLAKDQNEKSKYMTTARGMRFATSVGGTLTGSGGDWVIIDDPLNPSQAASDAERQTANDWMSSTVPSRLNSQKDGVIIVVMQRLHEDDVTGHLLEKGGWEHLCLPAKNDKEKIISIGNYTKIFRRDELLHPERMPQKVLDNLELELGSFEYNGQFLQRPVPKAGGILQSKWWREWPTNALPSCEYIIQVYDTAFKTGSMNDYSARTTWGIFRHNNNQPNIILLEAMNKRLTLPELREEALEAYYDFDPDLVLVEDKASGISLIQELKKLGMRLRAMPRNKGDDKVSRAHVASVMLEQGVVWMPKDKAWAKEVVRQCASFPNSKYDDLVDTVTDALIFLRQYKRIEVTNDRLADSGSTTFKPNYGGHYG